MAWPKFMQRLFANSGAGPLLREDIIPDTAAGNYLPLSGGTITGNLKVNGTLTGTLTGNADTATTLKTARTIRTNLASTSTASFNGSANITPGVTGILPIANGGTGASTAAGALDALGITDAIEEAVSGTSSAAARAGASITAPCAGSSVLVMFRGTSSTYYATGTLKVNGVTVGSIGSTRMNHEWGEGWDTYYFVGFGVYTGTIAEGDTISVSYNAGSFDTVICVMG